MLSIHYCIIIRVTRTHAPSAALMRANANSFQRTFTREALCAVSFSPIFGDINLPLNSGPTNFDIPATTNVGSLLSAILFDDFPSNGNNTRRKTSNQSLTSSHIRTTVNMVHRYKCRVHRVLTHTQRTMQSLDSNGHEAKTDTATRKDPHSIAHSVHHSAATVMI